MKINFSNYKSLLKITGLFTGVQGLSLVLNIVRGKIAAELLGPGGKGLNDIYNETREFIHTLTNCGMDIAGIRGISKKYEQWQAETDSATRQQLRKEIEDQIKLLRTWVLLFALFGTLICLFLAYPITKLTFQDVDHLTDIMLLSPAIGFSTLVCGELTVLKATRRIKALATVSIVNVILAILITLPFYQYLGANGIVQAIVCLTLAQFFATAAHSYRLYKPHFLFNRLFMANGKPMLKVGLTFTLTNIVHHGSTLLLFALINKAAGGGAAGENEIGCYTAGYSIIFVYASSIFASLDNDFFPRLTGILDNLEECRKLVWRQIRLSFTLAIPAMAMLILFLPWLLPMLNTEEFASAIPMAQIASVSLLFRAVYLPLAYLPLAAGDSRTYMLLEIISYIVFFALVYTGYRLDGLFGAGIGMTLSSFVDMCVLLGVVKVKYKI